MSNNFYSLRRIRAATCLLIVTTVVVTSNVFAAFSAVVSPPRFELRAKAGETLREVIDITHADAVASGYRFATADWALQANGTVSIIETLTANTCRPWVSIERSAVTLPANGRLKFRIEIAVPANATAGECRFALMVQGDEQQVATNGAPIPVAGRIGVIFYVAVSGAAPQLEFKPLGIQVIDKLNMPVLTVTNRGNAHGRAGGVLTGVDAKGKKFELVPNGLPILAGETRGLALMPNEVGGGPANPTLPLRVTGKLDWGDSSTVIDHEFVAPTK